MKRRARRVAEGVHGVLSQLFQHHVRDPRLQSVWITAVKVSGDLQVGRVYYRLRSEDMLLQGDGDEDRDAEQSAAKTTASRKIFCRQDVDRALAASVGFFRSQLSSQLYLKRVPSLRFYYDHSEERGAHMDALIAQCLPEDDVFIP